MLAVSLLPSIFVGVLLVLLTTSGRSAGEVRRLVWSPDVQVEIKEHDKKEDFRVAVNNRFEEQADQCYRIYYNIHDVYDHAGWMIVRLGNSSVIRQLHVRLANQSASLPLSVEALVSNTKTLNVTRLTHALHLIARFSDWNLFARCGVQQIINPTGNATFHDLTFVCNPPMCGSHVALYLRGLYRDNEDWAMCEVTVTVNDDETGMCGEDTPCHSDRCICPAGFVGSGYSKDFCSRRPDTQGCEKDRLGCRPSLVGLNQIRNRSRLLTRLTDFLHYRDSSESTQQQLTSADVQLLVPLMETAFPVNKSDAAEDVMNTALQLCIGLSDQLLTPGVNWTGVEEENRLALAMRAVETLENAGSAVAASLVGNRSDPESEDAHRIREAAQVSVQILPPGQFAYQSADMRGSRVNLSLHSASPDGLAVTVVSPAAFLPSLLSDVVSVAPSPSSAVTVELHFRRRRPGRARCVFWSPQERRWSSSGCRLVSANSSSALCRCRHLTSFALLLDVGGGTESATHRAAQRWISAAGGFASSLLLVYAVACFLALLRRQAWFFVDLHLSVCLLLAQLLLAVTAAAELTRFPRLCAAAAIALHLLLLCVFAWALNQGVRMYLKLVRVLPTVLSHRRAMLGLGYGVPLVLMVASVPLTFRDYGRSDACWMKPHSAAMWLFVGPAAAVMAANSGILVQALVHIRCSPRQELRRSRRRKRLISVYKVLFLMALLGLIWLFGFLVNVEPPILSLIFSYVFIGVYLSTSVLICLGYRLFSLDVRLALLQAMDRQHLLYGPLKVYADMKGLVRAQKTSQCGPLTLGSGTGRHGMSERQGLSGSSDSKEECRL